MKNSVEVLNSIFEEKFFARQLLDSFSSDYFLKFLREGADESIGELVEINHQNFTEDLCISIARLANHYDKNDLVKTMLCKIFECTKSYFWAFESFRYLVKFNCETENHTQLIKSIDSLIKNHDSNYPDFSPRNPHYSYWPLWLTPKIAERVLEFYEEEYAKNENFFDASIHTDYRYFIPGITFIAANENVSLIKSNSGFHMVIDNTIPYVPEYFTKFPEKFRIYEDDVEIGQTIEKYGLVSSSEPLFNHVENIFDFSIYQFFNQFIAVDNKSLSFDPFEDNPIHRNIFFFCNRYEDVRNIVECYVDGIPKRDITVKNFFNTGRDLKCMAQKFYLSPNERESFDDILSVIDKINS